MADEQRQVGLAEVSNSESSEGMGLIDRVPGLSSRVDDRI
jgi:hypothetical protein